MTILTPTQCRKIANQLKAELNQLIKQIGEHMRDSENRKGLNLAAGPLDSGDLSISDNLMDTTLKRTDREAEQLQEAKEAELRIRALIRRGEGG